jgi:hypothetical protein
MTPRLEDGFGPWNPGILSQVPRHLMHLATIFRPEHVFGDVSTAIELRDLSGLPLPDLVAFRPERLALHETLIRVTADLSVPDGNRIEDLGINFRQITRTVWSGYVEPQMAAITATYEACRSRLTAIVEHELDALLAGAPATPPPAKARFWLFRRPAAPAVVEDDPADHEARVIARWESSGQQSSEAAARAAYRALARVTSALVVRHGRVWGNRELIARLVIDIAVNEFASDEIGALIDPLIARAAAEQDYSILPAQSEPVVMNTKGASASGKSTLRPLQKKLAGAIGVRWSDFALISPDIWRKQLLDYATLGDAYKYAGTFTGDELQIVDQKLDRYMARKASRGNITHLLIDRFRFDSFAQSSDEPGSNLLTRFGHIVYLFFMITPPDSLVERAWGRGLEFGRYKAVDDTLAHGVEAYAGMPQLFATWVQRRDKHVYFEFLDNTVALGERPKTVAFGGDGTLNIMDVKSLLDIERFHRINVNAHAPGEIFLDGPALAADNNTRFLRDCRDRFSTINFADQATGRVYLRIVAGKTAWADRALLDAAARNADTRAGLDAIAPALWTSLDAISNRDSGPQFLRPPDDTTPLRTVGAWGGQTSAAAAA